MEVELKLLIDTASMAALKSHPALAAATRSRQQRLTTTYFDTSDFALRRLGASLRVRRTPDGTVQTVKLDEGSDGVGARGEWEWPVSSGTLDLDLLHALPEELAPLRQAAASAEPVFTTDIDRRTWEIVLAGSTRVEVALDQGAARAGKRRSPINEVELELKGGPRAPLFGFAIDLVDAFSLRYGSQSKAERGYALLTDELPPKHGADPVELPDGVTVAGAFPLLLNGALRAFAAEMPLASRGDIEGVHRLRAAIRKLRSLLVLFRPHLEPHATAHFNASLRSLGQVLGRGRDWDVFLTETVVEARLHVTERLLDPLAREAEAARTEAHAAVARTMDGLGPTRLLLGLAAWVTEPGWFAGRHRDRTLRSRLPKLLGRLERKVEQRSRRIEGGDVEALHDLRKSMKKLRFACEFVGPLYTAEMVDPYLDAIKSALSVLGEVNDASVTVGRIDALAPPERPELAPAAAALLSWNDVRRSKRVHKLDKKLHRFKAAVPFWS